MEAVWAGLSGEYRNGSGKGAGLSGECRDWGKMKKSLYIAFLIMGVALLSALWTGKEIDSGKENITITEEILSGDPQAAEGVVLQIASDWERHLFWDTSYAIGSGRKAESKFHFSAKQVDWNWLTYRTADMDFQQGAGFGSAITLSGWNIEPENFPFPDITCEVAEHAGTGEKYSETVSIGEYYPYYSVEFWLEGDSVVYEGDYEEEMDYLTGLFHIPAAEDAVEITVEKDDSGNLVNISGQLRAEGGARMISDVSAFGDTGCYYAWCCEDIDSGKQADRGENSGIFYLPFQEEDGILHVNLMHMEKVCPLPEDVIPSGMYLEEDENRLYLAGREEKDYMFFVYEMEGTVPVLAQRIPLLRYDISQERYLSQSEVSAQPELNTDSSAETEGRTEKISASMPQFRAMTREDGGMLFTWEDGWFAFAAEENGEYRLWCAGQFPGRQRQEAAWAQNPWEQGPFSRERQCLFDGERLVLAAFESWESLNVVVAVYREEREVFSARYLYGGTSENDMGYGFVNGIEPLGNDYFTYSQERGREIYIQDGKETKKPLSLNWK